MLLWSGQLISWMGTEVTSLALPLVVLALTGSPAQAGIVAAIQGAVYVIWSIPAGALVDRWNRKTVMVVANLGSGLAIGAIALGLALHDLTVLELYIACAVESSFFVFANLSRFASFPKIVSKEQFPAASAQMGTADHIAILIGPPLGGFLYQTIGGFITFLADAVSFIINAVSILFITTPLGTETPTERKAIHYEVKEAISWYRRQPILRLLNILTAGRVAAMAGLDLLIILLAKGHHASAFSIGLIFAVAALGGITGSLFAAKVHSRYSLKQLLVGINLLSCLIFGMYALTVNVYTIAVVTALFYAIDPLHHVATSAYSAKVIPDGIRGRVISLTRLQVLAANSLGFFISGITLQYLSSNWTIGLFTGLLFVLFVAVFTNPRLSQVEHHRTDARVTT